jgi:3-dehydroquinate dehydratase type I
MIEEDTDIAAMMEKVSIKKPDLLEVRLDKIRNRRMLKEVVDKKSYPLIATDKSNRGLSSKHEMLGFAAGVGFDLIDLDFATSDEAAVKQMQSKGAEVILSFHDYSETPAEDQLGKILEAEKRLGCDVCKIVTTALRPGDNLMILGFIRNESASARLVSFAMGSHGMPSRILSPWFGAEFTFASLSDKSKTAEGQPTIDELRSAWQILGLQ